MNNEMFLDSYDSCDCCVLNLLATSVDIPYGFHPDHEVLDWNWPTTFGLDFYSQLQCCCSCARWDVDINKTCQVWGVWGDQLFRKVLQEMFGVRLKNGWITMNIDESILNDPQCKIVQERISSGWARSICRRSPNHGKSDPQPSWRRQMLLRIDPCWNHPCILVKLPTTRSTRRTFPMEKYENVETGKASSWFFHAQCNCSQDRTCKFCDPECFHQLWLHQQKDNFVWIVGCGWCVVGGVCPSSRQECKIITYLRAFLVDFLHSIADISWCVPWAQVFLCKDHVIAGSDVS